MTTTMSPEAGPVPFFTYDHRACDALWAPVEAAADRGDGATARAAFAAFDAAMRRHLAMEEEVLFPALEAVMGEGFGPTRMMRMEHQQMRGVLAQMAATAASDPQALIDLGDTLWVLVQQHNMKEEGVLYPLAAARLGAEWPALAQRLAALAA